MEALELKIGLRIEKPKRNNIKNKKKCKKTLETQINSVFILIKFS